MENRLRVRALDKSHNLKPFDCDNERINNYFRNNSRKDHKAYKTRVFVGTLDDSFDAIGFYTLVLASHSPEQVSDEAKEKFGQVKAVPSIYLPKLGVTKSECRKGVGQLLLRDALKRCLSISENAGAYALTLDAIDAEKAKWYHKFGFQFFVEGELKMFIALKTVRQAHQES